MRTSAILSLVAVLCLQLAHASAATVAVGGDAGDGMVDVNGVAVNLADPTIRPGTGGDDVRGQAGVFFFPLPALTPSTIVSADFELSFLSFEGTPEFSLDLFGLGVRSSASVLSSDYYAGNAIGGSGTLIETGFLTPSASTGRIDLPIGTQSSFGAYLQSLYGPGGVPLDSFLVMRLNPTIPLPTNSNPRRGYDLATADMLDASLAPELRISTVPEPSTTALAVLAGLAVLAFGIKRHAVLVTAGTSGHKSRLQ